MIDGINLAILVWKRSDMPSLDRLALPAHADLYIKSQCAIRSVGGARKPVCCVYRMAEHSHIIGSAGSMGRDRGQRPRDNKPRR